MARWWLQCIAVTVLVGTSMTAWAIPGAVALPSGTICANTIDGCVHRTTVDSGSSVKLDSVFKIGIDKWDWRQGRVWVHVVGSATGFEFLSHVRTFAEFPLLQYHTDPLEGPAVYVFRMEMKGKLSDRAIVVVNAPLP